MSSLVTLTFDMNEPDQAKYLQLKQELSRIGMRDFLMDEDGRSCQLPRNTFAAYCGDDLQEEPCGGYSEKVAQAFKKCGVSAYCHITVSRDWSWKVGNIKQITTGVQEKA